MIKKIKRSLFDEVMNPAPILSGNDFHFSKRSKPMPFLHAFTCTIIKGTKIAGSIWKICQESENGLVCIAQLLKITTIASLKE